MPPVPEIAKSMRYNFRAPVAQKHARHLPGVMQATSTAKQGFAAFRWIKTHTFEPFSQKPQRISPTTEKVVSARPAINTVRYHKTTAGVALFTISKMPWGESYNGHTHHVRTKRHEGPAPRHGPAAHVDKEGPCTLPRLRAAHACSQEPGRCSPQKSPGSQRRRWQTTRAAPRPDNL